MDEVVSTVERAVETASPQVRPSSSDLEMTMLEISVEEMREPRRNSSKPSEMEVMKTLPSRSKARTGSPAAPKSSWK